MLNPVAWLLMKIRRSREADDRFQRNLEDLALKEAELDGIQQKLRSIQVSAATNQKQVRTLSAPKMLAVRPDGVPNVVDFRKSVERGHGPGFYRIKFSSESEG